MTMTKNVSRTLLSSAMAGAFLATSAVTASAATGNEWGGQDDQPDWDAIDGQEAGQDTGWEEEQDRIREDAYTNPNLGGEREQSEDWAPEAGSDGGAIIRDEVPRPSPGGEFQPPSEDNRPGAGTEGGSSADDFYNEGGFVEYDENGGHPTDIEAGFVGENNMHPASLAALVGGLLLVAGGATALSARRNEAATVTDN